ncbi:MAG: hypothetical protein H0W36_00810 [Gemmatimonadetes bacterium]|nr:hypothetical protein [Gemmatimonadota bacterium]
MLAASRGQVLAVALAAGGKVVARPEAVAASLGDLPGVTAVRSSAAHDDAVRFELHADRDVRAQVFCWAVKHGHVLVELTAASQSLEEVFHRLTTSEAA